MAMKILTPDEMLIIKLADIQAGGDGNFSIMAQFKTPRGLLHHEVVLINNKQSLLSASQREKVLMLWDSEVAHESSAKV